MSLYHFSDLETLEERESCIQAMWDYYQPDYYVLDESIFEFVRTLPKNEYEILINEIHNMDYGDDCSKTKYWDISNDDYLNVESAYLYLISYRHDADRIDDWMDACMVEYNSETGRMQYYGEEEN